ncbi:MAG: hypothetical protein AAFR13_02155 [Pseudomonadota bacterium]
MIKGIPNKLGFVAGLVVLLTGCQTVDTVLVPDRQLSPRALAALAVKEDYATSLQRITPTGIQSGAAPSAVAGPGAPSGVFGPQFGRYFLTDDFVVYRHGQQADPLPLAAATANDPSLGPTDVPPPVELTYFLVSPQGIVADYAVGTAPTLVGGCVQFIAASVTTCSDATALSRDLDRFDAAMRTSKGLPVSSWNVNASAASASALQ